MEVRKGKVHSIENGGTLARCVPDTDDGIVTLGLVIPFYWRETMGNLQVGDPVYFFEDEGCGGMVIARCDGEWDNTLRGSFNVTENITATGEITGQGIALSAHTHTDSRGGGTTPPN